MKVAKTASVKATCQKLKSMIAARELVGGEIIVTEVLRKTLGVDAKTFKKALIRLQVEDLVIEVPNVGLVIRNFSYRDVLDIFDCRIALEAMAIKNFAQHAEQARIDDLRNLLVPFEKGPQSAKVFQKINFHFHDIILAHCGNSFAYDLFNKGNIWICMEIIGLKRPLNEILQEHLDMVSAIHGRNTLKAALLMQKHLENSKRAFLS